FTLKLYTPNISPFELNPVNGCFHPCLLCRLSSGLIKQHFFVKDEKTWDSANNYCKTYFHVLSTFTNDNEQQKFLENAVNAPSDAWVGLYTESGVWKWSGGENATQISWDTDQPDKIDDCAFIHKGLKKLHDAECTAKYAFFCMNVSEYLRRQEVKLTLNSDMP
uniref:C-type lectin domain-containing protein n=1 Tax=Sinocyclocheilus rhinocerous TaxID=307959 RepID=A0A673H526_9TELE